MNKKHCFSTELAEDFPKMILSSGEFPGEIREVTAITKVCPDGQKVVALVAEYQREVDGSAISPVDFCVLDRFVTAVYPNSAMASNGGVQYVRRTVVRVYTAERADGKESTSGRFIIFQLSPEDETAFTFYYVGEHRDCRCMIKEPRLLLIQKTHLRAVDGSEIPGAAALLSSKTRNPVVEDFIQGEFQGLKYNLHFPVPYDPEQKYPLVQFIADSWQLGDDPRITLVQGQGATVWAEKEEQAVRPCFVLSPQFPGPTIVEDNYWVSQELETAKALLDSIIAHYNIDANRVYTTGQSMGTLSSMELNVRYPELFAGSLLISGFWNPETVKNLTHHSIWVVLSQGDYHSAACMGACMDALEANGVQVDRAYWDAKQGLDTLNHLAEEQAKRPGRVKFTVLKENSMVPEGMKADGSSNHRCTWQAAYQLPALREWLFQQNKT